jgi:hypothetical protein
MDQFDERYQLLDRKGVEHLLETLNRPCYESELLKIAFHDPAIIRTEALELYQNHFLLFHLLYELQTEYASRNLYLHIHFMRTRLLPYPDKGACRYYLPDPGMFCKAESPDGGDYCDFHRRQLENEVDTLSIRYFYLDRDNFNRLDRETAESFMSGTWEILAHYQEYKESFAVMELPETSSLETIKKQFKYLAKKYHPDLGSESHKKFNQINRAYHLLLKMIPSFRKN